MWTMPSTRREARGHEARGRQQPDGEVGARAVEVQGVESPGADALGGLDELVGARTPGGHGVVLVQAADVDDLLGEPGQRRVGVELGVHELRPRGRRAGHGGPVRRAVVDDLAGLAQEGQLVAPDAGRVEVVEQAGSDRARQADPRGAELAELEDPPAVPRRHVVERLLVGVEEPRALDVEVEVLDVDEAGAVAVGAGGQRARQRLLAQLGADGDHLAALDVGGEPDDEVGEALERRGVEPERDGRRGGHPGDASDPAARARRPSAAPGPPRRSRGSGPPCRRPAGGPGPAARRRRRRAGGRR